MVSGLIPSVVTPPRALRDTVPMRSDDRVRRDVERRQDVGGAVLKDAGLEDAGVHLVTGGLLRRGDRGLLVHRSPARRWYPDCWDLPGGHVEVGEAPEATLVRELGEELGISAVVTGEPFAAVHGADFRMDVWLIDQWDGEPVNLDPAEHDALAWVTSQELSGLRLADSRLRALFEAALSR